MSFFRRKLMMANIYGEVEILSVDVATIPASGGTIDTYNSISYRQKVGPSYITSGLDVTVSNSVTAESKGTVESGETNVGTMTITVKGKNGKSASTTVTVKQEANVKTEGIVYYDPEITSFVVEKIPASGGTISDGTVTYKLAKGDLIQFTSGATIGDTEDITSGGTITFSDAVTAENLETTEKEEGKVGQLTVTVEMNGKSSSKTVDVYQEANIATYNDIVVEGTATAGDIPASGGTVTGTGLTASQLVSYTSGATRQGEVTSSWSEVSSDSLGTTIQDRTLIGASTFTVNGEGEKSITHKVDVYQSTNKVIDIKAHEDGNYPSDAHFYFPLSSFGANGGNMNYVGNASTTATFSSGELEYIAHVAGSHLGGTLVGTRVFSGESGGFTLTSNGSLTAENRGTIVGEQRSINVTSVLTVEFTNPSFVGGEVVSDTATHNVTITQEANEIISTEYDIPQVSLAVSAKIPASGGTISAGSVKYTLNKTNTYTSGATYNEEITTGGLVSYSDAISASNLGTTVKDETEVGTLTATVTLNGKSGSGSAAVYQEANSATSITYGTPSVSLSVDKIPASGGTISSGTVTYSQTRVLNYTSGATSDLSALTTGGAVSYSTAVSASSLGTTVKGEIEIGTLTATVAMNNKSGLGSAKVYQVANSASYGDISLSHTSPVSISAVAQTHTPSPTVSQTITYTSGSTRAGSITKSYSTVTSKDWASINASTGAVTIKENESTTARNGYVYRITASGEGSKSATKDVTINQLAGSLIYDSINISSFTVSDIPASGGTISSGSVSYSQKYGWNDDYNSGTLTSGLTVTYSAAVSASSLGSTVKARTKVGTLTVTVSGNGKSASKAVDVYQAANATTSITYGVPSVSLSYSTISAAGGTVTPTLSYSQARTQNYTSGGTSALSALTSGATITYSGTGVNTSNGAVSASSKGTTVSDITNVTTSSVSVTLNGQKGSASKVVQQAANTLTYTGPSIVWASGGGGEISISGSTLTAKAGGGLAWIEPYLNYSYTSGSTSQTYNDSLPLTLSSTAWASTTSDSNVNVSSRGTTVGDARSITVTCTYNSKTSNTLTLTQQANAATSITYGTPTINSFSYSVIGAGGGTMTPSYSYSLSRTLNYTSGATSDLPALTSGATISFSGTGVNTSNGAVTAGSKGTTVSNLTTVTTSTISITMNSKSATKSATVSQAANAATSITYGTPSVSLSYSNIGAGGGTVTPTISYSQSRTQNYSSGSTSALSALTSGGTIAYSGASNNSTGAVTAGSKGTTASNATDVATVTATVTMNSKSGSASKTVQLNANSITTYGTWSVSVSANPTTFYAKGGTSTITRSASRTNTWASGSTSSESATPTLSISNTTGFTLSGTTVTVALNTGAQRTTVVTAAHGGVSKTVIITQYARHSLTLNVYSVSVTGSLTWNSNSYGTGSAKATGASASYQPLIRYSYDNLSTWTSWANNGNAVAVTPTLSLSSTSYFTISGTNVYANSNNTSGSNRTATLTVSAGGKSTTSSLTQYYQATQTDTENTTDYGYEYLNVYSLSCSTTSLSFEGTVSGTSAAKSIVASASYQPLGRTRSRSATRYRYKYSYNSGSSYGDWGAWSGYTYGNWGSWGGWWNNGSAVAVTPTVTISSGGSYFAASGLTVYPKSTNTGSSARTGTAQVAAGDKSATVSLSLNKSSSYIDFDTEIYHNNCSFEIEYTGYGLGDVSLISRSYDGCYSIVKTSGQSYWPGDGDGTWHCGDYYEEGGSVGTCLPGEYHLVDLRNISFRLSRDDIYPYALYQVMTSNTTINGTIYCETNDSGDWYLPAYLAFSEIDKVQFISIEIINAYDWNGSSDHPPISGEDAVLIHNNGTYETLCLN